MILLKSLAAIMSRLVMKFGRQPFLHEKPQIVMSSLLNRLKLTGFFDIKIVIYWETVVKKGLD
jgi:hypothetical protein